MYASLVSHQYIISALLLIYQRIISFYFIEI